MIDKAATMAKWDPKAPAGTGIGREVPEIGVELLNTRDPVPLGAGEATAGPTAAAIGNAISHALGARIRGLPLTRERIMAALLGD